MLTRTHITGLLPVLIHACLRHEKYMPIYKLTFTPCVHNDVENMHVLYIVCMEKHVYSTLVIKRSVRMKWKERYPTNPHMHVHVYTCMCVLVCWCVSVCVCWCVSFFGESLGTGCVGRVKITIPSSQGWAFSVLLLYM